MSLKTICFNEADFRIFRIFPAVLLGKKAQPRSVGICYMPTIYTKAINRYAAKGYVHLQGQPLKFYINHVPDTEVSEKMINFMKETIIDIRYSQEGKNKPAVCIFATVKVLVPFMISMQRSYWRLWELTPTSPDSRPYQLFLNEEGVLKAEELFERDIFEALN